jgi:hypothetical protein
MGCLTLHLRNKTRAQYLVNLFLILANENALLLWQTNPPILFVLVAYFYSAAPYFLHYAL